MTKFNHSQRKIHDQHRLAGLETTSTKKRRLIHGTIREQEAWLEAASLARATKQEIHQVNKQLRQMLKAFGVWTESLREGPMEGLYLRTVPKVIPKGWRLVHNHVVPTRHLGNRGFRAWLQRDRFGLTPCNCGWAPELGTHYRVAHICIA